MILRPPIKDYITIVPPLPRRRLFGTNPNEHKKEPVSIPFFGAYWFFRGRDKTLPADAQESRGDPAFTSFRTTDFTPMAMEARQHFGRLIDLSCCRAIQVFINNGDRRPGTVSLELILVNTRLTGRPRQSLGLAPVSSSLAWRPGDNRPAATEVLNFAVPPQPELSSFDEVVIRFALASPRQTWSAKIAIDHFRLIPRAF